MDEETRRSKVVAIDTKSGPEPKKILEEEEYLGRMAWIIRRDFIGSDPDTSSFGTENSISEQSDAAHSVTPRTDRTNFSSTSSVRSMQDLRSMRLDEYLGKYTSEDNAYFEKLQRKELKRHRAKYPWLYSMRRVSEARQLDSSSEKLAIEGPSTAIEDSSSLEFKKNTLFYPPVEVRSPYHKTTINYNSNRSLREPRFKEPLPVSTARPRVISRFTDKIGIDGKLLNGEETPLIGGFSFVPPPDTPRLSDVCEKTELDKNRYYIPNGSPRDDLASRLYEQKVAKKIRTPSSSTRSDLKKTPKSVFDKIF